jgi:hypothetical protein
MKNYYNIDYSLLATLLLPPILRRKLIIALLRSAMRGLDVIHGRFVTYAGSLIVRANNQVCYMQAMLNDEFDYYWRRIRVRVAPVGVADTLLVWKEETNRPVMLSFEGAQEGTPFLLFRDMQIGSGAADIQIILPVGFHLSVDEERRMRTLINRHKLASKKYKIIYGQN